VDGQLGIDKCPAVEGNSSSEREERASIGLASNPPFREWGTVFPDSRLVAAIVDRITFNAHILETGTNSYRLRTSTTAVRRKLQGRH